MDKIEVLIAQANSVDVEKRASAIYKLGRYQDPRINTALIAALGDVAAEVRVIAIDTLYLYKRTDPRAIPHLIDLLPDRDLRHHIVCIFGMSQDPRAIQALLAMLDDPTMVDLTNMALTEYPNPKRYQWLIHQLTHPDRAARLQAMRYIRLMNSWVKQIINPLIALLTDADAEVSIMAALTLTTKPYTNGQIATQMRVLLGAALAMPAYAAWHTDMRDGLTRLDHMEARDDADTDYYDLPIEGLNLTVVAFNRARHAGVTTIGDVCSAVIRWFSFPRAMVQERLFGDGVPDELVAKLKLYGYWPKMWRTEIEL
jgi:hypothetical protein